MTEPTLHSASFRLLLCVAGCPVRAGLAFQRQLARGGDSLYEAHLAALSHATAVLMQQEVEKALCLCDWLTLFARSLRLDESASHVPLVQALERQIRAYAKEYVPKHFAFPYSH